MITFLALALACNDHAEPAASPEAHAPAEHSEHGDHDAHGAHDGAGAGAGAGGLALSLNDGAKWNMDAHTRAVMVETRAAIEGAVVSDAAGAKALGTQLQEQLDRLIQGCTMDGAAHEELHTFLMVYMPAVETLQQVSDADAAKQVAAVAALVAEYDRFFE